MSAEVETMFSVRETPWHGKGIVIKDAPTSEDAIRLAGLDWEVKQAKCTGLTEDGFTVESDKWINYRDTDHKYLGTVGEQYKIVQNAEAFKFTDDILGNGTRYETAGSLFDGRVVWMLAQMPEKLILGDRTKMFLLFSNSHDGSASVRVNVTPVRVVCNNTLNMALREAKRSWSFMHKGDIESKLSMARDTLMNSESYVNAFEKEAERLYKRKFSDEDVKNILEKLFPIKNYEGGNKFTERMVKNMMTQRAGVLDALSAPDIADFKGTGWWLLNAISDYSFHHEPLRKTKDYSDNRMKACMVGDRLFDMAYELVA